MERLGNAALSPVHRMPKVFRDYQLNCMGSILKEWREHKTCIATVATGGGKTLIAAGLTKKLVESGRVLFLANRNELCSQPFAAFRDQGTIPALEKAESKAPLSADVVIGSVQTLTRKARLDRFPRDHFKYIFADEAHGCLAESWKRIFTHFDSAKVCGITATPFRGDGRLLSEIFATEAFRMDLFDLVDQGFLVDPDHVEKLSTAVSLANVRIKRTPEGKDYDVNDAADAIFPHFQAIARELKQRFNDRHILAFLPLVASSKKFVEACVAEGINAIHVDGEDPLRNEKLQAFREGRTTLLCNANLLHTGVDIPICNATLNLRPTKSKVLYTQIIGRSTRTAPGVIDGLNTADERLRAIAASGKPHSIVIDPLWLSAEHDLVSPEFLIAADEAQAEEMAKVTKGKQSYSLRQVQTSVQEAKEAAIRRKLEAAARFRAGMVPADFFAASVKDHELVNWKPYYSWEKRTRPSNFSKQLLSYAGIDPDSVKTEAHARKIMQAIGRRRYRKLAEIRSLAGLDGDDIWSLTEAQVRARRAA
jgi:superfamily II DNA or RNA helicase